MNFFPILMQVVNESFVRNILLKNKHTDHKDYYILGAEIGAFSLGVCKVKLL